MLVIQITIPIKGMKNDLYNRQPMQELPKKKKEKTVTLQSLLKKAMEN